MRRSVVSPVVWTLACLFAAVPGAWAQDAPERSTAQDAAVRVAYMVAEGAPVHVRVGAITLVSPAEAGSVYGYHLVDSGEHDVTIFDASEDAAERLGPGSAPVVGRTTGVFEPGGYYTLVVTDRAGEGSGGGSGSELPDRTVDVHVFGDRLETFAGAAEARIRMLNVLPGGASWSVRAAPVGEDRAPSDRISDDEVRIADAVPYGEAGPWVHVPLGIYRFRFGAESDAASLPEPLEVALHGGTLYTAYVYPGPPDGAARVAIRVDAVVRAAAGPAPARPGGPP